MEILLLWVAFSCVPAYIASQKGRSGIGFFFLSLIISPIIGFIVAVVISAPAKPESVASKEGKKMEALGNLAKLKDTGVLSEEEFQAEKTKIMNG